MTILDNIILYILILVSINTIFSIYIAIRDKEKKYPRFFSYNWTFIFLLYLLFSIIYYFLK